MSKEHIRERKTVEYTCNVCGAKVDEEGDGLKGWAEIVTMIEPLRVKVEVRHLCVECAPLLESILGGV